MLKIIGKNFYVHKTNISELITMLSLDDVNKLMDICSSNYDIVYDVLKIDTLNRTVSFITCQGWDEYPEPWIKGTTIFSYDDPLTPKRILKYSNNYPIYHNKWMFVSDNYTGFDIQKSKDRTKLIESIIQTYMRDRRKIGYFNCWKKLLEDNNIPLMEE